VRAGTTFVAVRRLEWVVVVVIKGDVSNQKGVGGEGRRTSSPLYALDATGSSTVAVSMLVEEAGAGVLAEWGG